MKNKVTSLAGFIAKANPIITGYCNYFRFGNSSRNFTDLSRWLYHAICNWLYKRKGWKVSAIKKHLTSYLEHENLPTPGGWFWYYGKWKNRRNDKRIIFLKRHASNFNIIYPKPRPQPGLSYYDLEDKAKLISMMLALSPARKKEIFYALAYRLRLVLRPLKGAAR